MKEKALSLLGPGLLAELKGGQVTLRATSVPEVHFFSIISACSGQGSSCLESTQPPVVRKLILVYLCSSFLGLSSSATWIFSPSSDSGQP